MTYWEFHGFVYLPPIHIVGSQPFSVAEGPGRQVYEELQPTQHLRTPRNCIPHSLNKIAQVLDQPGLLIG